MCARKPAQLHKQPSNLSLNSLQNHHHHLTTGVVQLNTTSLVTRLEIVRKHRRQLSIIPVRINLRQVWTSKVNRNNNMDMSNEINENLSNEIAEVKGCLHQNNFFSTTSPSCTPSSSNSLPSSNKQVLRDQNS